MSIGVFRLVSSLQNGDWLHTALSHRHHIGSGRRAPGTWASAAARQEVTALLDYIHGRTYLATCLIGSTHSY